MKTLNFNSLKANRKYYFQILICLVFVILDLYTTFLASPDLKLEGNWFVRQFGLKWPHIIIFYVIEISVLSLFLLIGMNIINKYYSGTYPTAKASFVLELCGNKKLLLALFLIGCFYSQLVASAFASVNNYLSYIYIFRKTNLFSELSTAYINFEIASGKLFFPVIKTIIVTCAFIYSLFKIRHIGIKTRISQEANTVSETVEIKV